MKNVIIYERKTNLIFHSFIKTTKGFWIASEHASSIAANTEGKSVGQMLLRALEKSKTGAPHPDEWSDVPHPEYKIAGVKTWSAFIKGTKACSVEEDRMIQFLPLRNLGAKEGFEPVQDRKFSVSKSSSLEVLGDAVLSALTLSEIHTETLFD